MSSYRYIVFHCFSILLVMMFVLTGLSFEVRAEEKGQDQGPVIVSPHDFVEKNLNAFKDRLRALKDLYENQYGSIFAATSPIDVEVIAKELPKPVTLRLAVQYPQAKKEEEKKVTIERGDYFIDNIYGGPDIDPLFSLTGGFFSMRDGDRSLVSADITTTQLLGIPQKIKFYLNGSIHWVSSERLSTSGGYGETCCAAVGKQQYCAKTSSSYPYNCVQTATYDYCSQYAQLPYFGFIWEDPRYYASQLNLKVDKGSGMNIDEKLKTVTFTSPGRKDISFVSSRKYSADEQHMIYRSCVPQFSYSYYGSYYYSSTTQGLTKAVVGYRPAGNESADFHFTAAAFKKFGFPGFEIDASFGKMPDLDYFYDPKTATDRYSYWGSSAGGLTPLVLLDYGDAGGQKAVKPYDIKAPVTWSTISPGPFSINEGSISYKGGIGTTKFLVTLGGYESVEHSITANLIDVVLDAAMKRGDVSPGKTHKVLVRVKGPADLTRYQVKWTGEGGSWDQSITPFKKTGEEWHAEGAFSTRFDGLFDPANLKKPVKITADVIRIADNNKIFSYENKMLATTYPAIDKLEMHAAVSMGDPKKVTEPIDLFISTESPKLLLSPRAILKDGKAYAINEINPRANIEVTSSNPGALYISSEKVRLLSGKELSGNNIMAYPGERLGTSMVIGRLGGSDIDAAEYAQFTGDQKELKSDPIEINVNNVFLIAESDSGGRTTYKLMVMGPTNMSKYQARWTGEATRTTPFTSDAGGFVSTLETTLRMDKVEIQKAGSVVAQLSVKTAVRHMNIKLLPSKPPVTTVKQVAVSDLGSLETITECKKSVSFQMEYLGFNPGMAPEEYCRADRQKNKQDILSQREDQKTFNQMVSDLNKQGQDLVVMSDTMRVGAAIKGDLAGMGDTPFCYWSLQSGGALTLQSAITSVETISPNEGACFNIVTGLKSGFNPDTIIKVDLIMLSKPAVPVVTKGERVVTYGGSLIR
jgi:hypothetical protein